VGLRLLRPAASLLRTGEVSVTRRGRRRLYVISFAAVLGVGAPFWAPSLLGTLPVFRIERVEIAGTVYATPDELLELAAIEPTASVWSDGTTWEERVRSHPLVREARVRRTGMQDIEIRVTEVLPLAFVAGPTLVPVDENGVALPLDPAEYALDLPVLAGDASLENGRVKGAGARDALRALAALQEYDSAFFGQISEIRWLESGCVEIELIEAGKTGKILLRTSDPVKGLRLVELALGHASDLGVASADARFEGQVVLNLREEG